MAAVAATAVAMVAGEAAAVAVEVVGVAALGERRWEQTESASPEPHAERYDG
jgi:hypothetical protein